jgi:acyl-coenzyme A synthetase/AMP-(fatty) acid ligase
MGEWAWAAGICPLLGPWRLGVVQAHRLAEDIKAFVREHHSAYAYPRLIEFVPDLPKTLTGKIRRIELREREQGSPSTTSPHCRFD